MLNPLTGELTVFESVEAADGEEAPWFCFWEEIESVVLMEGVTSICDRAFCECFGLESVQIPSSVASIEKRRLHGVRDWGQLQSQSH